MNTKTNICPICGGEETKTGKLHNVATLHSLDSRVGIGGSDLHVSFAPNAVRSLESRL